MEILFVLIPISMLLAGLGLIACIWAIRSGQYRDLASPPQFLVFEDDAAVLTDMKIEKDGKLNAMQSMDNLIK